MGTVFCVHLAELIQERFPLTCRYVCLGSSSFVYMFWVRNACLTLSSFIHLSCVQLRTPAEVRDLQVIRFVL